jgi:hypothetical protein
MVHDQFHLGHDFDGSKEQIEAGGASGSGSAAATAAGTGAAAARRLGIFARLGGSAASAPSAAHELAGGGIIGTAAQQLAGAAAQGKL